ncbi:hypothetical protein DAD186_00860 [Dermabacter vaginalis]|uniref:Uncharacterized protein n=1 Tax=Dermabacter vaginalis TaxID=1630135 RepID=A0A1B0ZFC8_9MICO|nr:hypothetical protein DAD186_00860 [Dermabacter vaginalis]
MQENLSFVLSRPRRALRDSIAMLELGRARFKESASPLCAAAVRKTTAVNN